MSSTKLIALKEVNDSIEIQLQKLGFKDYILNKNLSSGREQFYSPISDSICVYECEGYTVFLHCFLDCDIQVDLSNENPEWKIVSMFNSSSVNGYYICITENGSIIRLKRGNGESGDEHSLGNESKAEREMYDMKFKKDGITYYSVVQGKDQDNDKSIVNYSHSQVGQNICEKILREYIGVSSRTTDPWVSDAKNISVLIDKERIKNYYDRVHLKTYGKLGKITFLKDQYVIKEDFLRIALYHIDQKLSKIGFVHDIETNRFIREIGIFRQVFQLYEYSSDGLVTIKLNPRFYIESDEFLKFRNGNSSKLHSSKEIPIRVNVYSIEQKWKPVIKIVGKYKSISYNDAIGILISSIDDSIIPFFEYINSVERIAGQIDLPLIKGKWLLFIGKEANAKGILAKFYQDSQQKGQLNAMERIKDTWKTFFGNEDIGLYQPMAEDVRIEDGFQVSIQPDQMIEFEE